MADNKDPHAEAEIQRVNFTLENPAAEASTFTQSFPKASWESEVDYSSRMKATAEHAHKQAEQPQPDPAKDRGYNR